MQVLGSIWNKVTVAPYFPEQQRVMHMARYGTYLFSLFKYASLATTAGCRNVLTPQFLAIYIYPLIINSPTSHEIMFEKEPLLFLFGVLFSAFFSVCFISECYSACRLEKCKCHENLHLLKKE